MKIQVDEMERIRNFKRIIEQKNLMRTSKKILALNRRYEEDIKLYQKEIDQLKDQQQDLSRGLNIVENLLNRKTLGLKPVEIYRPPNYIDLDGVVESKLNDHITQGDFKIEREDGTTLYVELKATLLTLRDAINDPYPILKSKEWALSQGHDYRLLVVLPQEFKLVKGKDRHGEDTEENRRTIDDWLSRTSINMDKYENFMKRKKELFMRTLYLPEPVYAQPVKDYYTNLKRNEALFKEKQSRILEKIMNL